MRPELIDDPARQALAERVVSHFGVDVLDGHICEWRELDNGAPALMVDGGTVMFTISGENLHVTGPVPGGEVLCAAIAPDGTQRSTTTAPNPFSAEQAAMN